RMNRSIFHSLLGTAVLLFVVDAGSAFADQKIASVQADTKLVALAEQPKTVTITARISPDPTLRPETIAVGRYQPDGTLVATLATMHDDGQNGDAKAGDGIF